MKHILIILALMIGSTSIVSAKPAETIRVRVGQNKTADRGKVTILFVSVEEDSRCPINARCVWAGNAKIKIAVSRGKAVAQTVELNSGLKPEGVTVYGYEIKFVDLSPHPGENVKMVAMPKQATLSVKKV